MSIPVVHSACPDDQLLTSLIEDRLRDSLRDEVERHVAACATCADVIAAACAPQGLGATGEQAFDLEHNEAARLSRFPGVPSVTRWGSWRPALSAGLALAASALLAFVGGRALLARARVELAARVADAVGAPVEIGQVGARLANLRGLTLRLGQVRLGGEHESFLSADGMDVTVALAPLASGVFEATQVRLFRPALHVEARRNDGSTAPGVAGSLLGTEPPLFLLARGVPVTIEDGLIRIAVPTEPPVALEHLSLTSTPVADGARIVASGQLAGGPIGWTGSLPSRSDGTVAFTIGGRALQLSALPFLRGRLSGVGAFNVGIRGTPDALHISGRAQVQNGQAVGWHPLADLLGSSGAASAALAAHLQGDRLLFDDLRLDFVWHGDGVRIRRAHLTSGALVVGGSAWVVTPSGQAPASPTLTGSGTARLPLPLATEILAADPSLAPLRAADGRLVLPFTVTGPIDTPRFALRR